jgi:hypothetical protein
MPCHPPEPFKFRVQGRSFTAYKIGH